MVASLLYSLVRFWLDVIVTSHGDQAKLQAEVLALRRQVQVLERQIKRVRWSPGDRLGARGVEPRTTAVVHRCVRELPGHGRRPARPGCLSRQTRSALKSEADVRPSQLLPAQLEHRARRGRIKDATNQSVAPSCEGATALMLQNPRLILGPHLGCR